MRCATQYYCRDPLLLYQKAISLQNISNGLFIYICIQESSSCHSRLMDLKPAITKTTFMISMVSFFNSKLIYENY